MHVCKLYNSKQQHKVWRSKYLLLIGAVCWLYYLHSDTKHSKQPQKKKKDNMTGNGHMVSATFFVTP